MAQKTLDGHTAKFSAAVIECLPRDISSDTMQGWITNPKELKKALQEALCPPTAKKLIHPSGLVPKDWEVLEDVEPSDIRVEDMEFISFLEGEEESVRGETMRERAIGLNANLGLSDAKRILAEQDKIPAELRSKIAIVLTGTLLRYPGGRLHVACLDWLGDQWCLHFDWIDDDWRGNFRLPRRKR